MRTFGFALALLPTLLTRAPAGAQEGGGAGDRFEIFANSELERYLRVLQLAGEIPPAPWSLRGFSAPELDRLLPAGPAHPWGARYGLHPDRSGHSEVALLAPHLEMVYNSAAPAADAEGAIWAGRGVTFAGRLGFAARYRAISLILAPVGFWSQNAPFDLVPNGGQGEHAFWDPYRPGGIDLPQRFGDRAYGRLDWGESTVRADLFGASIGISTASQQWGPALRYPIILGSNAGGFAHGFIGTSRPLSLGIGTLHARLLVGALEESPYSPALPEQSRRMMNGLVALVGIQGVPGLEIGGARFFHSSWPADGIGAAEVLKPFESLLKDRLADASSDGSDPDNQLASLFARWVFPASGVELHGEFAREDHNIDLRDLLLEPDHNSAFLIGAQKVWRRAGGGMAALRGELVDARISHLDRVREQSRFYGHSFAVQGHTHRGKLLGSPAVYGGQGSMLGLDLYDAHGRRGIEFERVQRGELPVDPESDRPLEGAYDVGYALGLERVVFRPHFDLLVGLRAQLDLNRDERDRFGMASRVALRVRL